MSTTGSQLDFKIAIGYDLDQTVAGCPDAQLCAGAYDNIGNRQYNWMIRYRVNGATRQLIREVFNAAGQLQGTRVLANDVVSGTTSFAWNAGMRTVSLNLQIQYLNNRLPTGAQTIGTAINPLKSQVQLRNA